MFCQLFVHIVPNQYKYTINGLYTYHTDIHVRLYIQLLYCDLLALRFFVSCMPVILTNYQFCGGSRGLRGSLDNP